MNTQTIQAPTTPPIRRMQSVLDAEFCKNMTKSANKANAHFHANRLAIDRAAKLEENKHRLETANSLIRELHELGIRVQHVDIAVPRPRLYLQEAPLPYLPLGGVIRRRIDSEVFECSAIIDDCEVVWAEFDEAA